LALAGVGVAISARSAYDDYRADPLAHSLSTAQHRATWANALFGSAGAAAIATGAFFWLDRPRPDKASGHAGTHVGVSFRSAL